MVVQSKTPMPHTWLVSSFLTASTRGFASFQVGYDCFAEQWAKLWVRLIDLPEPTGR
jgi:hypothetical protein